MLERLLAFVLVIGVIIWFASIGHAPISEPSPESSKEGPASVTSDAEPSKEKVEGKKAPKDKNGGSSKRKLPLLGIKLG